MKKVSIFVLAAFLVCSSFSTSFASGDSTNVLSEPVVKTQNFKISNFDVFPQSTEVPKSFFDLSRKNYDATLTLVGKNVLYTNYYFKPNSDGKLNVNYSIRTDGRKGGAYLKIVLYDIAQKKTATTWTSDLLSWTGDNNGSMYFYNLDPNKNYAVGFTSVENTVRTELEGTATISW